jgi:hypothetical protein
MTSATAGRRNGLQTRRIRFTLVKKALAISTFESRIRFTQMAREHLWTLAAEQDGDPGQALKAGLGA